MGEVYRVTADSPTFNAVFFGDPGSGKTTLAASCQDHPDLANVLFANIEGGLLSISHRGDIHAVDIRKTEDLSDLLWELTKGDYEGVRTLVVDSATELQTINLEEIVHNAMQGSKGVSRSGKVRSEDDIWQDDYGKSTNQLKRLFRHMKDLPMNVIVTALAKYVYPKVAEGTDLSQIDPVVVMPSLTAKLGSSLMGYMDFVWYTKMTAEADKPPLYQVLTRSDGIYRAKTRGPLFADALGAIITLDPAKMMMPQIYDIFKAAQSGNLTPETPPAKPRRKAAKA